MASEVMSARESGTNPINAVRNAPSGKRLNYDDDYVTVYDADGRVDYQGINDYSPYKYEDMKWDEKAKNYKLPRGYRLVVRND